MAHGDLITHNLLGRQKINLTSDPLTPGEEPEDLGQAGLVMHSGRLLRRDDPDKETRTLRSRIREFRKMQKDPTIAGGLKGYENILSIVKWSTVAASEEAVGENYNAELAIGQQKFVKSCWEDMTGQGIIDIVSGAFDMLAIGFQLQVPQFKIRGGTTDDPLTNSIFEDGKIGWKSFKTIDQTTVLKWLTPDGEGFSSLYGIKQQRVIGGIENIPRNRLLIFRTTAKGDSPEGESILEGAYGTYRRLQRILKTEEVSIVRNLEGIPLARIPAQYMTTTASESEKSFLSYVTNIVQHMQFNDQTGLVLPSDRDDKGNLIVDIELMTAGTNARIDASRKIAEAAERLMAEALLATFLKLGGGGGGSYALSSDMTDFFVLAMRKYLDSIRDVINKEAIPTLLAVNNMDKTHMPKIAYEGLDKESVGVFVDALVKATTAGIVIPTKEIQNSVLEKLDISLAGADEAFEKIEAMQLKLQQQLEKQSEAGAAGSTQPEGTDKNPAQQSSVTKVLVGDAMTELVIDQIIDAYNKGEE